MRQAAGVTGLRVSEASRYLRQEGHVDDHELDRVVDAILEAALASKIGKGKIFVNSVDLVVRAWMGEQRTHTLQEHQQ